MRKSPVFFTRVPSVFYNTIEVDCDCTKVYIDMRREKVIEFIDRMIRECLSEGELKEQVYAIWERYLKEKREEYLLNVIKYLLVHLTGKLPDGVF